MAEQVRGLKRARSPSDEAIQRPMIADAQNKLIIPPLLEVQIAYAYLSLGYNLRQPLALALISDSHHRQPGYPGTIEDLEKEIGRLRDTNLALRNDHSEKYRYVFALAILHYSRFERLDVLEDLDQSIDYFQEANLLLWNGHTEKHHMLAGLGAAHRVRFDRLNASGSLDKAIDSFAEANLLLWNGHPDKHRMLSSLGSLQISKFERSNRLEDMDKAIDIFKEAAALLADEHPDKRIILSALDTSCQHRFNHQRLSQDTTATISSQGQTTSSTLGREPKKLRIQSPSSSDIFSSSSRSDHTLASTLKDDTYTLPTPPSVPITTNSRGGLSQPSSAKITSSMTISEIISCLSDRGCTNLTGQIDRSSWSEFPVCGGGFGDIYTGVLEGAEVAIKTMRLPVDHESESKKILKRVAHELYIWSKCQHPNVQPLLGLVEFRGQIGMVSTWETNGNLSDYIRKNPKTNRCCLSIQIAEGLSYLHQADIVHGDLKAGNVLVSGDGVPLLADFGNATLQEYTLHFTNTSTRTSVSTRWASILNGWMKQKAPELLEPHMTHSAPADVYALGMTILEAITGSIPWAESGDPAVIAAVLLKKEHPHRPEQYIPCDSKDGDTLWLLLERCWAYGPKERPSAAEVAKKIRRITQEGLEPKS